MFEFFSLEEGKKVSTLYWPPTGARLLQIILFFIVTTTLFFSHIMGEESEGLSYLAS